MVKTCLDKTLCFSRLHYRCLYLSAILFNISQNLTCDTVNQSTELNCTLTALTVTNSADLINDSMIYLVVIVVMSLAESFLEIVVPVLAGDQVDYIFSFLNWIYINRTEVLDCGYEVECRQHGCSYVCHWFVGISYPEFTSLLYTNTLQRAELCTHVNMSR